MTTFTFTGVKAIDRAMDLNSWDKSVVEDSGLFDCDTPGWIQHTPIDTDMASVYWMLLLYRDKAERISIEYQSFRPGDEYSVDNTQTVTITIETGDPGEPSETVFTITPSGK